MGMERIELINGVVIEIEDRSTHLSGELYMVHLVITFSVALGDEDTDLREYCRGGRLAMTRSFNKPGIHKRDMDTVLQTLKDSFLSTNLKYMEHPQFVSRFKHTSLVRFREQEEKESRAAIHEK